MSWCESSVTLNMYNAWRCFLPLLERAVDDCYRIAFGEKLGSRSFIRHDKSEIKLLPEKKVFEMFSSLAEA